MSYGDSKNFLANPKPARIPPQTPPAGGKIAEAGRIHISSQMFCPAESAFLSKKVRANTKITPPKLICIRIDRARARGAGLGWHFRQEIPGGF